MTTEKQSELEKYAESLMDCPDDFAAGASYQGAIDGARWLAARILERAREKESALPKAMTGLGRVTYIEISDLEAIVRELTE